MSIDHYDTGGPSGPPGNDYALEIRNEDGVLVARYFLYGIPVSLERAKLEYIKLDNDPPANDTPEDIEEELNLGILQGPVDNIPDTVRHANEVNKQRIEGLEIHE